MGCCASSAAASDEEALRSRIQFGFSSVEEVEDTFGREGIVVSEAFEGEKLQLLADAVEEVVSAAYLAVGEAATSVDVTETIRSHLKQGGIVEIPVGKGTFGRDPKPGAKKVLRVQYRPRLGPIVVQAKEFETVQVPHGAIEGLVAAAYGTGDVTVDVKRHVLRPLLAGQAMQVRSGALGGDPCPGKPKTLRVTYLPRRHLKCKTSGPHAGEIELVAPWTFRDLREILGVDHSSFFASVKDLVAGHTAFCHDRKLLFTRDRRFVVKMVSESELATLVAMLPPYKEYLQQCPDSLLTRYMAAYRIMYPDGSEAQCVVMKNVVHGARKLDYMYDLKATTEDRWVDPSRSLCLTDTNFATITLYIKDDLAMAVRSAIAQDCKFLEGLEITNYSLVVGIQRSGARQGEAPIDNCRLMGGIAGVAVEGVAEDDNPECDIHLGFVDTLSTYGLRVDRTSSTEDHTFSTKVQRSVTDKLGTLLSSTSSTLLLSTGIGSEVLPPHPYATRFREHFSRKIRGLSDRITLTPVDPEAFETPFPAMGRSGGTAAFFRVRYKPGCREPEAKESVEYWIGKDLARARDEVAFYELAMKFMGDDPWDMLKWMTPYRGICRAPCSVKEGKAPENVDVLVLRNGRDGYNKCRMLDIKIGVVTAVAGWQGKGRVAAWRQSVIDSVTTSGGYGSRLEGFDNPPETLRSFEEMLTKESQFHAAHAKKLTRFNLQCMTASKFLPLFLDLHDTQKVPGVEEPNSASLSRVEAQELVLLSCIEELANFLAACRKAPVPQQWIGSSVMLCQDSGKCPPREALRRSPGKRGVSSVHVFDWGRSELNTVQNHEGLPEGEKAEREQYWGYYCGGVAKLLYDCCSLYVARYWYAPQGVALTLWDKDRISDEFIGHSLLPMAETPSSKAKQLTVLTDFSGEKVKSGLLFARETALGVSMKPVEMPADSRLQQGWKVRVHEALNLPRMDITSATDSYAEVSIVSDSIEAVQKSLRTQASSVAMVREGAHSTTLAWNQMAPAWEEEFEFATLKDTPASRDPFCKALASAFGRGSPVSRSEVDKLFPRTISSLGDHSRSSLQRLFAQQCFPDLKVDDTMDTEQAAHKLSDVDTYRLIHFGRWLDREKGANNLFLLFLLCIPGGSSMSRDHLLKFCSAFLQCAGTKKWTAELKEAWEPLSKEMGQDLQRRCQQRLQRIAENELSKHWAMYSLQGHAAGFLSYDAAALPKLNPAAVQPARPVKCNATVQLAGVLRERSGQLRSETTVSIDRLSSDGRVLSEETLASAKTPEERVSRCIPTIIQAMHLCNAEMKTLATAEGSLGALSAVSGVVERRSFVLPAGGCTYAASPGERHMHFEVIGSGLLDYVRCQVAGMSDEVLLAELGDPSHPVRVLSTNSKSGEMFLISVNGRCLVKTISEGEAKALAGILPQYIEHFRQQPDSLLGRYLALCKVNFGDGGGDRYFTIMQSVFDSPLSITNMYDLKGSTFHRKSEGTDSVRKDQDWVNDRRKLRLSSEDALRMSDIHKRDSEFLQKFRVIDYSVLVGIASFQREGTAPVGTWLSKDRTECYHIGIIDFLVEYGLRKRAEHAVHHIRGIGNSASVTDPASYAQRQHEFFKKNVLEGLGAKGDDDVMSSM